MTRFEVGHTEWLSQLDTVFPPTERAICVTCLATSNFTRKQKGQLFPPDSISSSSSPFFFFFFFFFFFGGGGGVETAEKPFEIARDHILYSNGKTHRLIIMHLCQPHCYLIIIAEKNMYHSDSLNRSFKLISLLTKNNINEHDFPS